MTNLSSKLALGFVLASPLLLGGCAGGPFVGVDVDGGPGYYDYPGYYGDYDGGVYYRRGYYRGGNSYHHDYNGYRTGRNSSFSRGGGNVSRASAARASSSGGQTGGGHGGGHGGGGHGGGGHR